MNAANPTIAAAELLASPSAWLTVLASAIAKGDDAQALVAKAHLRELDWLVLSPGDLERLKYLETAAGIVEPAEEPAQAAEVTTSHTTDAQGDQP